MNVKSRLSRIFDFCTCLFVHPSFDSTKDIKQQAMSGLKSSFGLIRTAKSIPTGSSRRACQSKASTTARQSDHLARFRYYATTPTDSPPSNPNGPQWQMPPLREAPLNSLGPSEPPQKGYRVKVAHVFFGLTGLGLFIAIYGMYVFL